ncbi:MAG: SNF2-related protein [Candidatus Acidiferrales bacterium]
MDVLVPKLQTKNLRRAPDAAAYQLYRAAQEWDLTDPILIKDRQDLKSEHKWRDHIEPYHHQVQNLITFCRRLPVTLIADDVGLGKTISAGLIASELMTRNKVSKFLVVCPKLLMPQWKEELESKFGIPAVAATGKELLGAEVPEGGGAIITTYQSARMYLKALGQAGFEMLVLDEAHKLRNLYGANPSPQVAQQFREALANRMFKYVLMLTATPIHNRLWDIYSLVDLLAVARGHQNPFGSEGIFARTFIADNRMEARHLNPQMREAFRSVVYGYMSRIRRADANLHFPERIVQLHRVTPSNEELELIRLLAGPIQNLNRLSQISILQALISSPHALLAQLKQMARNRTIPDGLAESVEEVVGRIRVTAKLQGLATLVDRLRAEQPERWRVVVFTTRRETQTTIEAFLGERGVTCGLINGDSGERNQRTITKFKKQVPEIHAIVSTEAGSEGVNLQAANVVVNFDLPWNPMIVEQRIGRVQRLASEHASVCIFNIILRGTFEEYIVGRLMEKLQMASHAIGDIEAILQASGVDDDDEDATADGTAFVEKIRELVIASLAGKNVETATRLAEKSITDAKVELDSQEKNINAMLGGMDEGRDTIPYPDLPRATKSMEPDAFVLAALKSLGTEFTPESEGVYASERDGKIDRICFDEAHATNAVLYRPGTPAFSRLTTRIAGIPFHRVQDVDEKAAAHAEGMAREWIGSFFDNFRGAQVQAVDRSFAGTAEVRVRATVGHDSYERLVDVVIPPGEHWIPAGVTGASPITDPLKNPEAIGLDPVVVIQKAMQDEGVAEFCRFYLERRKQELEAAGTDARKRKKIEDDFTPQLEAFLVGLEGTVQRRLEVSGTFDFGSGPTYETVIAVIPAENRVVRSPELSRCSRTQKLAPLDCLGRCEISGVPALKHLFEKSEVSGRMALPEFMERCTATGKRALRDELEESAITKQKVSKSFLKTSGLTGKRAEPQYFQKCEFTGIEALDSELATSQVSGKKYRADRQQRSIVSGKTGYTDEFAVCSETLSALLPEEGEKCEVTGKLVVPRILERCEVSSKRVLPRELEKSVATGKKALKQFFVSSSISGARFLPGEGIVSAAGKHCLEKEAKVCAWSSRNCHPDDLRTCQLTRVEAHFEYMTSNGGIRLEPLLNLLNGVRRKSDKQELWPRIVEDISRILDGRSQIEAAASSPGGDHLAVSLETKSWLGLRTRQAGFLYSVRDRVPVGRVVLGKRETEGWELEKVL